jgi:hypothetical protein
MCLELIHENGKDYINSSNINRDPHLTVLIQDTTEHFTETQANTAGLLKLEDLRILIRESAILPLDGSSTRPDNFKQFWNTIHPSIQKENSLFTKPSISNKSSLLQLLGNSSNLLIDLETGKIKAEIGPKHKNRQDLGKPPRFSKVQFKRLGEERKENNGSSKPSLGFVSSLLNAIGLSKGKDKKKIKQSDFSQIEEFESPNNSENNSLEEECIRRVMQENARLREQVSNIRKELRENPLKDNSEDLIAKIELETSRKLARRKSNKSKFKDENIEKWVSNTNLHVPFATSDLSDTSNGNRIVSYPGVHPKNDPPFIRQNRLDPADSMMQVKRRPRGEKTKASRMDSGLARSKSNSLDDNRGLLPSNSPLI